MQKKHETRQINCTLCPNIQEKLENQKISGITGVISLNDFSPLYFKDRKENDKWIECFDSEGWLHTGDLGIIDADDFIYIRGRCKNMLLGPSGQNIYPEEMEAKLNNQPFVLECVITEREGKLVAFVFPDPERIEAEKPDENRLRQIMAENCKHVNKVLPKFAQLSSIILVDKEFEKTPKRNIKRYLYT